MKKLFWMFQSRSGDWWLTEYHDIEDWLKGAKQGTLYRLFYGDPEGRCILIAEVER